MTTDPMSHLHPATVESINLNRSTVGFDSCCDISPRRVFLCPYHRGFNDAAQLFAPTKETPQ